MAVLAIAWFGYVYQVSRVTGAHPIYLQLGGPDQMTLRWGSVVPAKHMVEYGLSPDKLILRVTEVRAVSNHRVTLTNLTPDTKYYYRIVKPGQLSSIEVNSFVTSPPAGTTRKTRIWLLGDPGKSGDKVKVRDAAMRWLQQHPREHLADLDLIMSTGDQAYPNATYHEYVKDFLLPFQSMFKRVPVWPVFGNHDARRWSFYQLFDRPEHGELGGLASNSKSYFSFDYAQTHFIFLDSNDQAITPGSPMLDWLVHDLAMNKQTWTIVLFHHPPYTRGSYDSDRADSFKHRFQNIRSHLLPILELAQVDLVISGHSHAYEHSGLIHGHYGPSKSFNESMVIDAGQQIVKGARVYKKDYQGQPHLSGTLYLVLGASGEGNQGQLDHPALPVALGKTGSVILDIDDEFIQARYISAAGKMMDEFTIRKPYVHTAMAYSSRP
ncbi:MAG: metallophosphoesterase family protein [Thioalkalispiraceae bacterium]